MKNFLSVGNNTQAVLLDDNGLTLVLGENVDQGMGGSRNGVGKTTLIQAIFFALYGVPLTNIKKDNLINKTNQRAMAVSLEYEVDGNRYRIERGRKPNFIRYMVNDGLVNSPDTDEGHGESKWTQAEIEKVIGCSHNLAKHIIALHTKTTPFLSLGAGAQREIIEELVAITQISQKSVALKKLIKDIGDEIKAEEVRIKTVADSNERIQKTINDLSFKSKMWDKERGKKLERLENEIIKLSEIDIEAEIANHRRAKDWYTVSGEVQILEKEAVRLERQISVVDERIANYVSQIERAGEHSCPMCGGEVHDSKHEEILLGLNTKLASLTGEKASLEGSIMEIATGLEQAVTLLAELGDEPVCRYGSLEEALNHRNTMDRLTRDLERECQVDNPYIDQIANLSESGLQDVDYKYLNELVRVKEHQDFLFKLLTSKDSFIRKKIIDQNLSYLNHRLGYYLGKLALPHEVEFKSDLSVEITQLGKDFDFEQLSNGEANRLILALSWSFRDMWESMHQPLNLMMIDELVDSGMDSQGMDSALEILKQTARERGKNIFLISHKDELVSRVEKILLVQKENGFTSFLGDQEMPEA
jgi:DNA repair exonuclease SbcCD ATPase subunit